jgi:hypothetical protein
MNSIFFAAAWDLARAFRYGKTIKGTRKERAMWGWIVIGISPIAGHAADSVLDTTIEDTRLYFTSPLRWDEEDWMYFWCKPGRHCRGSLGG